MSSAINGSSAIQRYEGSDVIEICNGITKQANIHTHVRNAVTLVWGSLRLTPIMSPVIQMPFLLAIINHVQ